MTIFRGSRYQKSDVTTVRDAEGRLRQFLHDRSVVDLDDLAADFSIYVTNRGDNLGSLAHKHGGKATRWWIIADVNGLDHLNDLPAGTKLIIPSRKFFGRF